MDSQTKSLPSLPYRAQTRPTGHRGPIVLGAEGGVRNTYHHRPYLHRGTHLVPDGVRKVCLVTPGPGSRGRRLPKMKSRTGRRGCRREGRGGGRGHFRPRQSTQVGLRTPRQRGFSPLESSRQSVSKFPAKYEKGKVVGRGRVGVSGWTVCVPRVHSRQGRGGSVVPVEGFLGTLGHSETES